MVLLVGFIHNFFYLASNSIFNPICAALRAYGCRHISYYYHSESQIYRTEKVTPIKRFIFQINMDKIIAGITIPILSQNKNNN